MRATAAGSGEVAPQLALARIYGGLETGSGSLLLKRFAPPPGSRLTALRSYVIPFAVTAFLGYGVLFAISAFTLPTFVKDPRGPAAFFSFLARPLLLPFVQDFNVAFMLLVTLPVMMTLLLTERAVIPACLASIAREGVLDTRPVLARKLCTFWTRRFHTMNRVGQIAGLAVGLGVAIANYGDFTTGKQCWQCIGDGVYLSGWLFVFPYLPVFFWVAIQYLIRAITTIFMLRAIVRGSRLHLNPFHEDRCGGLKMIGRLGLRNQYFLLVGGINVVLILLVMGILGGGGGILPYLLLSAAAAYVLFGPLFFLGPLLPFRASMRKVKLREERRIAQRLSVEYADIMGSVETAQSDELDQTTLTGLIELRDFVRKMPVWPFDVATLRRFLAAYAFPVVLFLVGIVSSVAIGLLQDWLRSITG